MSFDFLSPRLILGLLESSYPYGFQDQITSYPSYINRVYGLKDHEGRDWVAKFYRPERWSLEAIEDEHVFIFDLEEMDVPLALPEPNGEKESLSCGEIFLDGRDVDLPFVLFPKKSGRLFEPVSKEDWIRIGELVGRIHLAGAKKEAYHRLEWTSALVGEYFTELLKILPKNIRAELSDLGNRILDQIDPLFDDIELIRIHGDLHRGNILERGPDGLFLMDLDDMVMGPRVQDLWLLLPDHAQNSTQELGFLLEGYHKFSTLDPRELRLLEALRFMRIMHFQYWASVQRDDQSFSQHFPDWGSEAHWIREMEDWKQQWVKIQQWDQNYPDFPTF